jgi:hypothetical protein
MKALIFRSVVILVTVFATPSQSQSANELLNQLDSVVALRGHYSAVKEQRIRNIKRHFANASPTLQQKLAQRLYMEYYTYHFDSAMHYARLEHQLAVQRADKRAETRAQTHLAMLFAIGGYYSQSERLLQSIQVDQNDPQGLFDYYITGYRIYTYWSDYCRDKLFSPRYDSLKLEYLRKAIPVCPNKRSALYYYFLGEQAYCENRPLKVSTAHYQKAIDMVGVNTRIYASAAYALARNYLREGRMREYEDWLIRAAISDQVTPLKENLALQELAMYLFRKDENNAEKSTHYIYCSMEDAQFYNNRLRILEISRRLPAIVSVYQNQINSKRQSVTWLSVALGLLVVLLLVGITAMVKQRNKLNRRGREIDQQNHELALLNERLRSTDASRSKYMRLIMDLCATYIGKMNDYRKLVVRKVKAHQTDDLLRSAASSKLSDQEEKEFYTQFDKAFLELYPQFVEQFNALLKPDSRLALSRDGGLTTEMRIYALVRLGVDESVEIATLLFYSPQTIYNYRTAMRKRALRPDTFEAEVKQMA